MNKLKNVIANEFSVEQSTITPETSFEEDLGADSIDLVELVMALEEEFDVGELQEDELNELKTVADVLHFLQGKLGE